jgi:hypothetical protein
MNISSDPVIFVRNKNLRLLISCANTLTMIRSSHFAKFVLSFVCAAPCLTLPVAAHQADVAPSWHRDLQNWAPEALTVKVQTVTTQAYKRTWGTEIHVKVSARVEQVERSRDNIKPGQVIEIRYLHNRYTKPKSGARELPILQKNKSYPAFLEPDKKHYVPGAGSYSFEKGNAPSLKQK